MTQYKILTPGPLTTTAVVKAQMMEDRCTWDEEYKQLTQEIRQALLEVGQANQYYTTVLQQGSGSFVVESVLQTSLASNDHILIISNGAYGERMVAMAETLQQKVTAYRVPFNEQPDITVLQQMIQANQSITHIAFVHCETTTGMLNPLSLLCDFAQKNDLKVIVDAMSSFGGIPIDIAGLNIDYLISSANKCIQGVPGFGFVIAKKAVLEQCKGNAQSVVLDLYEQWKVMEQDGKWRFTSPTHVVAAFKQALNELTQEGGVEARYQRYQQNNDYLIAQMKILGFEPYIDSELQSPIITTFLYPDHQFNFNDFYQHMKAQGYVLYPGKLMEVPSFRIGNIGDLHRQDFEVLIHLIKDYQEKRGV
ncbi:2-aminoethylphosphonate--pyruvate transaminase [Staphylococcus sp. CH99b_3]|uniref:2-aminoethylphosphonate--pyruvate transaminase n=1 Tax=Staphylococcus sp. CH99b_3 TaxID=2651838 RepID=UPI00124CA13A|nr:2-aminoethylphosphonate--pyruvate transaminase [Staphylococcus sp. CH99b_3]KAB2478811.1 2-aminoethylphosphonate--pyruvate transaminase [Staphylococcus sp. CH99b_3]